MLIQPNWSVRLWTLLDLKKQKKQKLHNEQYVLKIFLPFKHNITEPDFNCEWFLN